MRTMEEVVVVWHAQLSGEAIRELTEGLRKLVDVHGPRLPIGTAFAGREIAVKALATLEQYWRDVFDIEVYFHSALACEIKPEKRKFLASQRSTTYLVEDGQGLDLRPCATSWRGISSPLFP